MEEVFDEPFLYLKSGDPGLGSCLTLKLPELFLRGVIFKEVLERGLFSPLSVKN